jgi:hypothetical protein
METLRQKLGHAERLPAKQPLVSNYQKETESFQRRRLMAFSYSSEISMKLADARNFRDDDVK